MSKPTDGSGMQEFLANVARLNPPERRYIDELLGRFRSQPDTEAYAYDPAHCRVRTSAVPRVRRGRVFLDFGLDYLIIPLNASAPVHPKLRPYLKERGWYGKDKLHFMFATDLSFLIEHKESVESMLHAAYQSSL